ncbi:hypothetical protein MSG28_011444 [Choristoneura fumiferana]|uniref:Uncharacterized protein n=1 Tax=Choristoneura fumiferana TaxID=7141 RepID=A0ACC0JNH0_CHOFU|nr:hypothetical protein MSG28_011444 [Choristoneura fumiferana]
MKKFNSFAYALTFLIVLCGSRVALAEEKCQGGNEGNHERSPFGRRNSLFDQDFGLAFSPGDFLTSVMSPFGFHEYYRPWRHLASFNRDVGSTIKTDKDKFTINLDVQHFSPEDITVKTVDGYVVVEGKHEEKEDEHGFVSRQFVRRYSLPEGVAAEQVSSQLSSDGVLTVTAPRQELEPQRERLVPITPTGPVRKEAKDQTDQETCDKDSCSKQ